MGQAGVHRQARDGDRVSRSKHQRPPRDPNASGVKPRDNIQHNSTPDVEPVPARDRRKVDDGTEKP